MTGVVPTKLKLIRGNPGKRAIRPEPQPCTTDAIPEPPDHLDDDAKAEWRHVSPELYRMGLLTTVDLQTLAAYCTAYGTWIGAKRALAEMAKGDPLTKAMMIKTTNGNAIMNPMLAIANKAARDLVKFGGEFGFTPAARTRIALEPDRPPGKFSGLIAS